jgi:hypothetical protein
MRFRVCRVSGTTFPKKAPAGFPLGSRREPPHVFDPPADTMHPPAPLRKIGRPQPYKAASMRR